MVKVRAFAPLLLTAAHLCTSRNVPPGLEAETSDPVLLPENPIKSDNNLESPVSIPPTKGLSSSHEAPYPGAPSDAEYRIKSSRSVAVPVSGKAVVSANGVKSSPKSVPKSAHLLQRVRSARSESGSKKAVRSTKPNSARSQVRSASAQQQSVKLRSKSASRKLPASKAIVVSQAREAAVVEHVQGVTAANVAAKPDVSRISCKDLLAGRPSTPVVAAFKTMTFFLGGSSRVGVDPDKAVAKALKVIESMFTHSNVGIDIATLQQLKNCAVTPDDQRTFLMQIVALGYIQTLDESLALNLRTCPLADVKDAFGNNILHLAVKSGNVDVCDRIFNALQTDGSVVGKLLTEKNADGYLALDLAKMQQQADIISSLQAHYTVYTHTAFESDDAI